MTFRAPNLAASFPPTSGADRGGQGSRRDNPTREGGDPHGLVHQGGEQTGQSRRGAHDRRSEPRRARGGSARASCTARDLRPRRTPRPPSPRSDLLFLDPDGDQDRRRRQKRRRDPEGGPDADEVGESTPEERPGRGGHEDDHLQGPEPRPRPLCAGPSPKRAPSPRRPSGQAPLQRLEGEQLPRAPHEPHQAR